MKRVYILLGGMAGWVDGWAFNPGMNALARQIAALPDTRVTTHFWTSWQEVVNLIRTGKNTATVLIGYSGGGSRLTWVAKSVNPQKIDLAVGYDPSPLVSMGPFRGNVVRALCYTNQRPNWAGLGGGHFSGSGQLETFTFTPAMNHLTVQSDQRLHDRTIAAIQNL